MISIAKNGEPRSLTEHRATSHSTYENYAAKDELRASLVAEQFGLCCYCMSRIRSEADSMKIEHWQCQDRYAPRQLEYANLLGACLGGHGSPRHKQHCDTRKGNADLKWNPADPAHAIDSRVHYGTDGGAWSNDDDFSQQLDDVLNLNLVVLKNSRKGVLDGIVLWWKAEKARLKGPVPRTTFERELSRCSDGPSRQPFCGVAIWWLRERIGRMS